MNIVVNAVLAFSEPRGVGRYINNLLPALAEIDKENNYYIYYGKWMKKYSFLTIQQENFKFIELDIKNSQISRNLFLAINLPLMSKKYKPDIYFLIDTQATFVKPCKTVSVIHDLAEFQMPDKYSKKQAAIRKFIVKNQIRLSDKIITVSKYSQNGICRRFGLPKDRVHVIYNALAEMHAIKELQKPENYFLFVSEVEKAKNLQVMVEAFAQLPQKYRDLYEIRVVGKKGNNFEEIQNLIENRKLKEKVRFYGYVTDEELKDIYSKAYAFVFPSLFEGFGLPVLEAMGNGVPVLCSNAASIPEVGGEAVLTFNPYKADELCRQMINVIENKEVRQKMIQDGLQRASMFTTSRCANETLEVFKKIGEKDAKI